MQVAPSLQPGHVPPPQSTSVSLPFAIPSVHEGIRQYPPEHTSEVQSRGIAHACPGAHGSQSGPPQSR
jgi:hypothetical protein